MSATGPVGKAISMAHKADAFAAFCADLRRILPTEDDRWAAYVLLACHDVGKSAAFRAAVRLQRRVGCCASRASRSLASPRGCFPYSRQVNDALPPAERSDDHDRALASALHDDALCAKLLPSVAALPAAARSALRSAAACGFNLPQAAQGEAPLAQLAALSAAVAAEPALREGTALEAFLQHCVFDIAGAACNDKFALPLAIEPVFVGFCRAKDRLLKARAACYAPGCNVQR